MGFPALHGNFVDLILFCIVIFYFWEGLNRGFLLGFIDLIGFVISFLVSLRSYGLVSELLIQNFSLSKGISHAAGFLIVGFLSEFLFSSAIIFLYRKLYHRIIKLSVHRKFTYAVWLNNLAGVLPAIFEAGIFSAFILTLFLALPIAGWIKKDIVSSKFGSILVDKTSGVEKSLNRIFGQALNETLTFLTVNSSPMSSEKVDLHFTQSNVTIDVLSEDNMLILVNRQRSELGLNQLTSSSTLRDLARAYAKDMFVRGFFSHYDPDGLSPFDRMKSKNIVFLSAGENLAFAPNVQLAHSGLMNSPGHKANILSSDFGKVGIGVIDGGIYGQMFVQEFTD